MRGCMPHVCRCLQYPEEGIGSPQSGVKGNCEPSDLGFRNQTPTTVSYLHHQVSVNAYFF